MNEQRKATNKKRGKTVKASTSWGAPVALGALDATPQKPDQMSPDVVEFIKAMDDYRTKNGRPFPSWSEVLAILTALGYRKIAAPAH